MNIGIDVRFLNESGVGRYIRNLIIQLQKIDKKNQYTLFVLSKDYGQLISSTYKSQNANGKWKIVKTDIPWHSLDEQIKLPGILAKENIDLMHFTYISIPVFYNKPFIVTIHDLILHHFSTGKATTKHPLVYHGKRLGYKYIMNQSVQKSKKIIAVSTATKQEIIDHLKVPENKIEVIYEGVDVKLNPRISSPQINSKLKNIKGKYFLHVGNLYPHKNMEILLDSLKKFKYPENIDYRFVIAGKEDYFYHRFQKEVKKAGIEKRFIFLGEVDDAQLQNLYKFALALFSPSLMEGFDLPVLEAMSNNCLILASDIPAHKEICKDTAIYFDPFNPSDLSMKIKMVCIEGKENYFDKISKARNISLQFSWEKMARKTLKIYEESYALSQK